MLSSSTFCPVRWHQHLFAPIADVRNSVSSISWSVRPSSKFKELSDYEIGYVKEGVGAGGMSILAFLKGFSNEEIVSRCQVNLERMKELGQISLNEDC